jgi:hypothetical protein
MMAMHALDLTKCRNLPTCEYRKILAELEEAWKEYDAKLEQTRHDASDTGADLRAIRDRIDRIAARQRSVIGRCEMDGMLAPGNPNAPRNRGPVL